MEPQDQLGLLLRVNAVLHSTRTLEQIMADLIQEVIATLQAKRGFVVVRRDQEWEVLASHRMEPEHPDWIYSRTVVQQVAESGEPVLTSDAMADRRFAKISSVTMQTLHSIVCAPLRWDGEVRGVVYADHNIKHGIFRESHLEVLKAIADQASRAMEMAALHQQLQLIHQQHASPAATVDYLVQTLSEENRPPIPAPETPARGLVIRLFGPFQVWLNGTLCERWSTRKNRDLLAYLASQFGQVVHEDKLVDLFWDQGGKSGLHSLHNGVTQLRKALGKEAIVRTFDGYKISPEAWVDAEQFGRIFREGRRAAPEEALNLLSRAEALVEGDFLEGFQAEWVDSARQRWSEELHQCRALLAENFAHHGKHILAVEVWKRVLQCDNCCEEGYRGLFLAYRALGRQADALRLYQSCVSAYAEELDLEPPDEFVRLAHF